MKVLIMKFEIKLSPTYHDDVMDIWQNMLSHNEAEWTDTDPINRTRQIRMFLFGQQVALRVMHMDTAAEEIVQIFQEVLTNDNWEMSPEWDLSSNPVAHLP